jgi:hypothetical protein
LFVSNYKWLYVCSLQKIWEIRKWGGKKKIKLIVVLKDWINFSS